MRSADLWCKKWKERAAPHWWHGGGFQHESVIKMFNNNKLLVPRYGSFDSHREGAAFGGQQVKLVPQRTVLFMTYFQHLAKSYTSGQLERLVSRGQIRTSRRRSLLFMRIMIHE